MVSFQEVEEQLKHVGCNFKMWGRTEVRELSNVLMPQEKIAQAVNGTYEGGFALLVVTNCRVLLIDRKPMLLTIEDIRYDMMSEVDFSNRLVGASVRIFTPMRNLVFNSWSNVRLRKCVNYIQQRVMELRQHALTAEQLQAQMVGVPQPLQALSPQSAPAGAGGAQLGGGMGYNRPMNMNAYTRTPLVMSRKRRFPTFY